MMKKASVFILMLLAVCIFCSSAQARVDQILNNPLLQGKLRAGGAGGAKDYKYKYFPISYGSGQSFDKNSGLWMSGQTLDIGGGADALASQGIDGGGYELGDQSGFIEMNEDADIMRFRFGFPDTFVDTGEQTDLVMQFYVSEQVTVDAITYDVNIYEFMNTTPIITDQFTVKNGTAAGWVNLVTNSTGIGNDSDIDADDILVITVSPQYEHPYAKEHKAHIYGCRIKYRPGIEATQE